MPGITPPQLVEATWLRQLPEFIRAIAESPDGERIAVADASGQVLILGVADGESQQRWQLHDEPITGLRWPRPDRLVSIAEDGTARIIDPEDYGRRVALIETDAFWIEDLDICHTSKRLALCAGKKAQVWSLDGDKEWESQPHESTVSGVSFLPQKSLLATACYGAMRIWDHDSGGEKEQLTWKGSLFKPHPSPDGSVVACGCQDDSVHFWRLETGRDSEMSGYPAKPRCLAWSTDSTLLATSAAQAVLVWSFSEGPEGTSPFVLQVHEAPVSAMGFHPTRKLLLSGSEDGIILLWAPQNGPTPMAMATMVGEVSAARWLPRDNRFVAGDSLGYVGRFDPRFGV